MDLQKKIWPILVLNYYFSALLLGIAGVIKLNTHEVGDLLEFLFEHGVLSLEQLVLISRTQPVVEIVFCLVAILGVGGRYTAYGLGIVYLFFAALIYYASEGYLFLAIDCGCFGEGDGVMAIWLIARNCFLGVLLFLVPKDLRRFTLWRFIKKGDLGK